MTGKSGGVLGRACIWVRHLAFRAHVRSALQQQAALLPHISLKWLPTTGFARSAVQIRCSDKHTFTLIIAQVTMPLCWLNFPKACISTGLFSG